MTIEVPDGWAVKFAAFDKAEALLRERFTSDGLSCQGVTQAFAAFGGTKSAWKDPAFRVWAALKGCVQSDDFFEHWRQESEIEVSGAQ